MSPSTPQRTLVKRSAAPTPAMAELTTWLVLTGRPKLDADDDQAAGCHLADEGVDRPHPVEARAQRADQPPAAEHGAERHRAAEATITQSGTANVGSWPAATSPITMMPMVFGASLAPWLNASPSVVSNLPALEEPVDAGLGAAQQKLCALMSR